MKYQFTDEEIADAYRIGGTMIAAAKSLQMPRSTYRERFAKLPKKVLDALEREQNLKVVKPEVVQQEHQLKREVRILTERNKSLEARLVEDRETAQIIKSLDAQISVPKWVTPKRKKSKDLATACVMLSDLHYGETVNPHEMNGANAYNLEIAEQRTRECFSNIIKLSADHIGGVSYQGCVVFLGGDIVSGRIHEELNRTNDPQSVLEQATFAVNVLGAGLNQLQEHFGKVHCACVVGNHGRLEMKKHFKGYVKDSIDRLIYTRLRERLPSISWQIPEATDCLVSVNESRYLLTHGDQFRGGSGISGILTPLKLGAARKRQNLQFDYMVMGHFHQLLDMGDIIVNGSMKGWDEFAAGFNFPNEPPQQAFWLDQPGYGKTITAPIHCKATSEDWSVFREALA